MKLHLQQHILGLMKEVIVTAPVAGADGQSEDVSAVEPEAAHKVYLTFDDGPSKYTEEILDILDTYDVKATFFAGVWHPPGNSVHFPL